jgi:nucleoside-diphosphate-sugar epimerase
LKYLITGATGFIGPHLIKKLADEGHFCRCLVRNNSKTDFLEALGAERVQGDITRPESLEGIADGVDRMLHMATLGHMSNFSVTEAMFEAINVHGTRHIMAEALRAGVDRIVHCSTVAAMGICEEVPATEESVCSPHHPYGRSKLQAEQVVLDMARDQNLPAAIVRFSMVYGPGDPRDILKLTRLARKGLFPKVGRRPKLTPLIHVNDAIQGMLLAAEKGGAGEKYLITNGQSLPFDSIRKILQQALGIYRLPLYIPEWAALTAASLIEKVFPIFGEIPPVARKNIESTLADRVFSIDKARREIGFDPQVDPAAGLKETVEWYMERGWV